LLPKAQILSNSSGIDKINPLDWELLHEQLAGQACFSTTTNSPLIDGKLQKEAQMIRQHQPS